MPFDLIYLVYGLIVLFVIILLESVISLITGRSDQSQAINKRLKLLSANKTRKEVVDLLRYQKQVYGWDPTGILNRLSGVMEQAGIRPTSYRRILIIAALAATVLVVIFHFVLNFNWQEAFIVSVVLSFGAPFLVILKKRNNRLNKFSTQLPDAVDVMIRSLRAGHPVPSSVALVAKEMADPIGTEFGLCSDEMTFGQDLHEALSNMSKRVGHPDLRFFVVAVGIQRQVGGNLAEVLANISKVIRDRFRMKSKIHAISAEGRASAGLLSVLPILLVGIINLTAPTFYTEVWDDPIFLPVLSGAAALAVFGDIIMYRMVNFKF